MWSSESKLLRNGDVQRENSVYLWHWVGPTPGFTDILQITFWKPSTATWTTHLVYVQIHLPTNALPPT